MNPIKHWRRKAYHTGFADGLAERAPKPPRLFQEDYQFGYEWGWSNRVPRSFAEFKSFDWTEAEARRSAFWAKWFPEVAR